MNKIIISLLAVFIVGCATTPQSPEILAYKAKHSKPHCKAVQVSGEFHPNYLFPFFVCQCEFLEEDWSRGVWVANSKDKKHGGYWKIDDKILYPDSNSKNYYLWEWWSRRQWWKENPDTLAAHGKGNGCCAEYAAYVLDYQDYVRWKESVPGVFEVGHGLGKIGPVTPWE